MGINGVRKSELKVRDETELRSVSKGVSCNAQAFHDLYLVECLFAGLEQVFLQALLSYAPHSHLYYHVFKHTGTWKPPNDPLKIWKYSQQKTQQRSQDWNLETK